VVAVATRAVKAHKEKKTRLVGLRLLLEASRVLPADLEAAGMDLQDAVDRAAELDGSVVAAVVISEEERPETRQASEIAHKAAKACAAHVVAAQLRRQVSLTPTADAEDEVQAIEQAEKVAHDAEEEAHAAEVAPIQHDYPNAAPAVEGPPQQPPDASVAAAAAVVPVVPDESSAARTATTSPNERSAASDTVLAVSTPFSGMHVGSYRAIKVQMPLPPGKRFGATLARDDRLPTLLLSAKAISDLESAKPSSQGVVATRELTDGEPAKTGETKLSLGEGLLVTGVDGAGAAASFVQAGDVIVQVDGKTVDKDQKPSELIHTLTERATDGQDAASPLERTVLLLIARPSYEAEVETVGKATKHCGPSCIIM